MTLNLVYEKLYENDTAINTGHQVDADNDTYAISGVYNAKGMEAGLLYKYYMLNSSAPAGAKSTRNLISPYVKATFGPVYIEGEATYWFGKYAAYEAPAPATTQDIDLQAYSAYFKVRGNFGPAYAGVQFGYVSGNDLSDDTKNTTAWSGGGPSWSPALLLMNDGYNTQSGGVSAASPGLSAANPVTGSKYNVIVYNAFGGFNPTPKLNLEAALTYATVAQKALSKTGGVVTEAVSDKLGTEIDIKATYKIYGNLTYMIGAGYLMTGDYFKGADSNKKIDDDYVLLNQLTLSF